MPPPRAPGGAGSSHADTRASRERLPVVNARSARLPVVNARSAVAASTLLPPKDLHDHGHQVGHGDPAYVLIMTGDDQTQFKRNEWDLTGRHPILEIGDIGRWLASTPMPDA